MPEKRQQISIVLMAKGIVAGRVGSGVLNSPKKNVLRDKYKDG